MIKNTMLNELHLHIIDNLQYMKENEVDRYASDLHFYLFKENDYIVGNPSARAWIKEHELDIFDMIEKVYKYEKENYGRL